MNKDEYQKLVDELKPKEPKLKRAIVSFVVGGCLGLVSQIFVFVLESSFGIPTKEAFIWLCITKSKIVCASEQWKQHRGEIFLPPPALFTDYASNHS